MSKEDIIRIVVIASLVGLVLFGEETPMVTLGHQQTTNLIVSEDKMRELLNEYMEENPKIKNILKDAHTSKLHTFITIISKLETGGLVDKNIRTNIRGSGSSAFGEWQITRGLLMLVVQSKVIDFTEQELEAINLLTERQRIALQVGGKDRKAYALGGKLSHVTEAYTKQLSFDSPEKFLDAFDYGGNLGLGDDVTFMLLYNQIAHKLLSYTLEQANGDMVKAAGIWHGGLGNKGKHIEIYKKKFRDMLTGVHHVNSN